MEPETLARRLGLRTPESLEKLAIHRGCRYYDLRGDSSVVSEEAAERAMPGRAVFSNAELAVALLVLFPPVSLLRQRMGAAMLSAPDVDVQDLASLAVEEGCAPIVHYIARCASDVEPERDDWKKLQALLSAYAGAADGMPHPTRFIEMTGITRGRVGILKHWIRPVESLALA